LLFGELNGKKIEERWFKRVGNKRDKVTVVSTGVLFICVVVIGFGFLSSCGVLGF
jgi:hypothetical protein